MTSVLPRFLGFQIQPVEQIGQVVGVFHLKVGLPSAVNDSGRIRHRVPHSPAIHEFSHLVAHERSLAQ